MPNRFTKAASDVLNNAMSNARTLGHTYIGTEHILLGLLSVENGVASKLLTNRGVTFEKTRELVSEIAGTGEPRDVYKRQYCIKSMNHPRTIYQVAFSPE